MDRRKFVLNVAGLPLVFGLWKLQDEKVSKEPKKKREDTFSLAKKRMKKRGQTGLVFVLPQEKSTRKLLACALFQINSGFCPDLGVNNRKLRFSLGYWDFLGRQALILTSTSVLICLEESEAKTHLGSTAPRMVIDETGKIIRKLDKVPTNLADGMLDRLLKLVHGQDLVELKKKSKDAQASLDDKKRKELETLIKELSQTRKKYEPIHEKAYEEKRKKMIQALKEIPQALPWCASVLLDSKTQMRSVLRQLYSAHVRPIPILPVGSILPVFQDGPCTSFKEVKPGEKPRERSWNVACGMGSFSLESKKFLRFVGDK